MKCLRSADELLLELTMDTNTLPTPVSVNTIGIESPLEGITATLTKWPPNSTALLVSGHSCEVQGEKEPGLWS